MRIDKIINTITTFLFPWSLINKLLWNSIPFQITLFARCIMIKKKILLKKKWTFNGLRNIEWDTTYHIPLESFQAQKRKPWISAIARLKNWEEFLEKCLTLIIDEVDEIVLLVDTSWSDSTNVICKKFSEKFGHKVKHFEYNYEVYPWNHDKYSSTPDHSVHALSYFYNFCVSKSSYSHIMKFDDDMLAIKWSFSEIVTQIKKENSSDTFYAIPQINISKDTHWNLAIASKYLHSWIAWLFLDHWVFPVSESTYFFNDTWCENLIMNLKIKYMNIWFFHLKNLKSDRWTGNYEWYSIEYINSLHKDTSYTHLPLVYKTQLDDFFK